MKLSSIILENVDLSSAVPEGTSYKDFAKAVAKMLKEDYGEHNYGPFMEVLHAELGMDESVSEGFKPKTTRVNGEDFVSKFQGRADNLEDFLKAIDNIPDEVGTVNVDGEKVDAKDKEAIKAKVKEIAPEDVLEYIIDGGAIYQKGGETATAARIYFNTERDAVMARGIKKFGTSA